jgi:hypothetical protein
MCREFEREPILTLPTLDTQFSAPCQINGPTWLCDPTIQILSGLHISRIHESSLQCHTNDQDSSFDRWLRSNHDFTCQVFEHEPTLNLPTPDI